MRILHLSFTIPSFSLFQLLRKKWSHAQTIYFTNITDHVTLTTVPHLEMKNVWRIFSRPLFFFLVWKKGLSLHIHTLASQLPLRIFCVRRIHSLQEKQIIRINLEPSAVLLSSTCGNVSRYFLSSFSFLSVLWTRMQWTHAFNFFFFADVVECLLFLFFDHSPFLSFRLVKLEHFFLFLSCLSRWREKL